MTADAGELRAGIWEHDAELFGIGGKKGKETGEALSLEYRWKSPKFLSWARSPQPYIGGLINLNGNTSYGSAGLAWQGHISEKFYLEYATGLTVHDGTKEVPSPNNQTDPLIIAELIRRKNTEIEFGSSVLFRNAFGIGYDFSDDLGVEIVWEHLSHAKIFDDVNEGVDNVGVRFAKKF